LTAEDSAFEEQQPDAPIRVAVSLVEDQPSGLDPNPEFLVHFPDQGIRRRLSRFDLASGELPEASEKASGGSARDQDPSIGLAANDADRDDL
jgi:hypothetical protein